MGKSEPDGLVMREVKRAQNAIPLGSYATAVSGSSSRSNAPSEPPSRTYLDPQEIITQPEPAHHRGALPHSYPSSSRPAKGYSEHEKPGRSAQVVDGAESLAARRSHTRRKLKAERRPKEVRKDDDEEEGRFEDDSDEDRYGTAPSPTADAMIEAPDPLTSDAKPKDADKREKGKHRKPVLEKWTYARQYYGDLAVAREFNKRESDIEALERTRAELGDYWNQAQRRQVDLAGDLAKRAKVVEDLEHQLSSSRAFVEASSHPSSVVHSLTALSALVESTAQAITTSLVSPASDFLSCDLILSYEHLATIASTLTDSGPRGTRLLQLAIELTKGKALVWDWIHGVVIETLAVGVWEGVLGRFHPALDVKADEMLRGLYEVVRTTEPQDRSARWRSITHSRAAPSAPSPTLPLTNTLLSHLFLPLSALLPTSILDLSPHAAPIANLIDAALAWHQTAMVDVLSWDVTSPLSCSATTSFYMAERLSPIASLSMDDTNGKVKEDDGEDEVPVPRPASPYEEDHHWRDFREPDSEDDAPEPGNGGRTPWTKPEEQVLVILSTALITPDGSPDWSLIGSKLGRTQSTCKSRLFAIMKMRGEPAVTVTRKRVVARSTNWTSQEEAKLDTPAAALSSSRQPITAPSIAASSSSKAQAGPSRSNFRIGVPPTTQAIDPLPPKKYAPVPVPAKGPIPLDAAALEQFEAENALKRRQLRALEERHDLDRALSRFGTGGNTTLATKDLKRKHAVEVRPPEKGNVETASDQPPPKKTPKIEVITISDSDDDEDLAKAKGMRIKQEGH
ncbi:hypothetical protein RQP46_001373 [Phenoliferia psychrophenolica]